MEREELYLNEKNSYRRPSDLELKLQKLILLIDIVSIFVEKWHRSPSDQETRIAHRCVGPHEGTCCRNMLLQDVAGTKSC